MIYVIGSLRNPRVPEVANELRATGRDIFDDWYAPGPNTDDFWKKYEQARGRSFREALGGLHAENAFRFDHRNLLAADAAVLVLPAGKSAHMELGWLAGKGKLTFILIDDPERWDLMYRLADGTADTVAELVIRLEEKGL